MPAKSDAALGLSRFALRALVVLNLVMGAIIIAFFIASFALADAFLHYFERRGFDPVILMPALRIWMLLALPYVAAVHVMLSRLLDMIETVRSGTPFVPENAARLKTIAWALLATQLLHLLYGVMVRIAASAGAHMEWRLSGGGWIAVLLLFVLARVFDEGTRIREDLEGMI